MAGSINTLTASTFNQLGQYTNSPGQSQGLLLHRTRRFFPSRSRNIASTHFAYPRRDDQAELAWVTCLNTKTVRVLVFKTPISVLTHLDVE